MTGFSRGSSLVLVVDDLPDMREVSPQVSKL
jgi:hypothetical protein